GCDEESVEGWADVGLGECWESAETLGRLGGRARLGLRRPWDIRARDQPSGVSPLVPRSRHASRQAHPVPRTNIPVPPLTPPSPVVALSGVHLSASVLLVGLRGELRISAGWQC